MRTVGDFAICVPSGSMRYSGAPFGPSPRASSGAHAGPTQKRPRGSVLPSFQKKRRASNGAGANGSSRAVRRSNRNSPVRSATSMRSPEPSANDPVHAGIAHSSSSPLRGSKRCSCRANVSHQ